MLNILKSYSLYDTEVGYLQGMNYPVACLLYNFIQTDYQDLECYLLI